MPDISNVSFGPGVSGPTPAPEAIEPAGSNKLAPVPGNLLGTKSPVELQLAEDAAGSIRAWEVMAAHMRLPGTYDANHLRDIHAHVMQDIYPNPGATRNDELLLAQLEAKDKGTEVTPPYDSRLGTNDEVIVLVPADQVNARLDELSAQFKRDNNLRGLEKPEFVAKLTDYYLQYSKVSPFAAGNEHVLAPVFNDIGRRAGYDVRPEQAKHLREATDAILAAGLGSDRTALHQLFSSVTKEAEGIGPKALRNPTLSPIPEKVPPDRMKREHTEDMVQAGAKLAAKLTGPESEQFNASMRALLSGNTAPEHIDVARTAARTYPGADLAGEVKRIEQGAAFLDTYRRTQQGQDRAHDQANVRPRESGRAMPSEITR